MKLLLTGGLGYIGCETLLRFSQRPDITVYVVDNDQDGFKNRSAYFVRYSNIKFINADITKKNKYPTVDLIIHLAASVGYTHSSLNPELTKNVNIDGTYRIAELCKPTIFFSTGSVYGSIGKDCNELVQVNPQSLYAETKYKAENIINQLDQHIIFRPATAMGLSIKTRHDLLVHDLSYTAIKKCHIDLYQPDALRSFYSVYKCAELIEFACDNFKLLNCNIYNVGCEKGNTTKQQLVNYIKQYTNFTVNAVDGSDADTRDYHVSYKKLSKIWPDINEDFTQYLAGIVEYYKTC